MDDRSSRVPSYGVPPKFLKLRLAMERREQVMEHEWELLLQVHQNQTKPRALFSRNESGG